MTAQQMLDHFRLYVDDPNSDRWSNTDALRLLSRGQELAQHYIDQADQGFFSTCVSFSVVKTEDALEFDLPTDVKLITQVERVTSTDPVPARHVNFSTRHLYQPLEIVRPTETRAPWYYLRANQIGIVDPTESYTLRVFYIRRLPELTSVTDVSDIPAEHHNFVVLHATKLAHGSEGRAWQAELAEEYEAGRALLQGFNMRHKQEPRYVNYIAPD